MSHVILGLLLAHIISDFYCQTDNSCKGKKECKCREWIAHCVWVFGLSFLTIFTPDYWIGALLASLVVMLSHMAIDTIKVKYENRYQTQHQDEKQVTIWTFVIDQTLHLMVIFAVTFFLFNVCQGYHCWMRKIDTSVILIILAFFAAAKPANIFVRTCLKSANITIGDESAKTDKFHSGKIIGTCERFLILTFVLLSQYEAIGFLVAAKSILRFGSTQETEKSEYVLAGTLLSISIALVLGLIVVYRTAIGNFVNTILPFIL